MSLICLSPQEFVGYDILLEFLFSLVALTVALFAFKAYKMTSHRQIRLFSAGFMFIFFSYITQALFSALILLRGDDVVCQRDIFETLLLNTLGFYSHVLFMIIGLLILVYMTFRTKKFTALGFLITITLVSLFFSQSLFYNFYLLTAISFGFLSWHFIETYMGKKNNKTLLVIAAFGLLTASSLIFLVSLSQPNLYVFGKLFELVAYMFILTNFYLITKVKGL